MPDSTSSVVSIRQQRQSELPFLREIQRDFSVLRSSVFPTRAAKSTLATYHSGILSYCRFRSLQPSFDSAATDLLSRSAQDAANCVDRYISWMMDQDLATATIACRIAALAAMVRQAKRLGVVDWDLEHDPIRVVPYRDVAGPGIQAILSMLEIARSEQNPGISLRNECILLLLFSMGLRRSEVASVSWQHIDASRRILLVRQKGASSPVPVPIPKHTFIQLRRLHQWQIDNNRPSSAAFIRMDNATPKRSGSSVVPGSPRLVCHPLSDRSIYRIVVRYGNAVGVHATPHGLRHAAITTLLDSTNGDIRSVQRFSRHKSIQTVMIYDDRRKELDFDLPNSLDDLFLPPQEA